MSWRVNSRMAFDGGRNGCPASGSVDHVRAEAGLSIPGSTTERRLQEVDKIGGLRGQKLYLRVVCAHSFQRKRDVLEYDIEALVGDFGLHGMKRHPDDPAVVERHLNEDGIAVG